MLKRLALSSFLLLSAMKIYCQDTSCKFIGLSGEDIISTMKLNINYTYTDKLSHSNSFSYILKYEGKFDGEMVYLFFVVNEPTNKCTSVVVVMPNKFLPKTIEDYNRYYTIVSKDNWTDYFYDFELKRESPVGHFRFTVKESNNQF